MPLGKRNGTNDLKVKDNKEKDKIRAKTIQNQEETRSVEKSRIKPDKVKAQCAKCGHPVNGPYCQGCTLLREKLEEDLSTYPKYFHDTSESSDDSTNVVNAPREPFVVKKDHGVNPPQIDKCCCECGNALDGIFCQQCICKSCGKGAHTGYNCPPKVPIIFNSEPCNQTINNELPQTLPSFDLVPYVSKPNFVDQSSKIFNPPPQHPVYSCEFCGSNAQNGHYCTPKAQFNNLEQRYSQDFNFSQNIHNFQQQNRNLFLFPLQDSFPASIQFFHIPPRWDTTRKFKEDLFTSCVENGILPDSSKPSNNNTNVVNALQEPFVVNQDLGKNFSQSPPQINHHCCYGCGDSLEDVFCHQCTCELCGNGAHYGYNCVSKVPIIPDPKPFNNQAIKELPQTVPSFNPTCYSEDGNSFTYDSTSNLFMILLTFSTHHQNLLCILEEEKQVEEEKVKIHACYDDDDDDYTIAIAPKEPNNSLSMGDEHLDTLPAMKSDEFIKFSVENLVPNLIESKGEHECDVPAFEVFTTFSNILFDADYDFFSSDDQSFSDEDIPKEIYSNPLFDEEIISMKINTHHFNVESHLIESLLNHDSLIISSSLKINSIFDEFAGRIYFENSNAAFESFSPSPIPVEDSDSLMKEIDLSITPDDPMPPGIEEDDYDSERDILIHEELLSHNSFSLPKNESFHFDIPSSSRPPAKPPDGNSGILNVKVMGDISEPKVPMPKLMSTQSTLVLNQEKSPKLLPHLGYEAF
nr:hypothetical protein [Tanacetum cinerariifolium]